MFQAEIHDVVIDTHTAPHERDCHVDAGVVLSCGESGPPSRVGKHTLEDLGIEMPLALIDLVSSRDSDFHPVQPGKMSSYHDARGI